LLGFIYTKKLVLLLSTEGKKWCFYIRGDYFGGKMWEIMVGESGGNITQGIIPIVTSPLTI